MTGRLAGGTLLAMRKEKNKVDAPEAPAAPELSSFRGDSFSEEPPMPEPTPEPVKVEAAPPKKAVNLTTERRVAYLEGKCVSECSAVEEMAVTRGAVHRLDKDGNVVIENGMPVTDRREMLTRDVIKAKYAKMINAARAGKL